MEDYTPTPAHMKKKLTSYNMLYCQLPQMLTTLPVRSLSGATVNHSAKHSSQVIRLSIIYVKTFLPLHHLFSSRGFQVTLTCLEKVLEIKKIYCNHIKCKLPSIFIINFPSHQWIVAQWPHWSFSNKSSIKISQSFVLIDRNYWFILMIDRWSIDWSPTIIESTQLIMQHVHLINLPTICFNIGSSNIWK